MLPKRLNADVKEFLTVTALVVGLIVWIFYSMGKEIYYDLRGKNGK